MAASDEVELVKMINTSVDINDKPSAIRYPRGTGVGLDLPSIDEKIEIGKGKVIQEGNQVCILSCLLYTSPSPRDVEESRMPSSA